MFIVIVVMSKIVIEENLKISGASAWTLAICVGMLAMIGIANPENEEIAENQTIEFILLPYILYGLLCVLAALLGLLFRNPKRRERILGWFIQDDNHDDRKEK